MMTSKAGKPFCCIKLTDLTAYNMPLIQAKVTKELEPLVQKGAVDKSESKTFLSSFT